MITDNEYIDMAHTVMGMHHFEDGSKNQIKAMLHFAELYHEEQVKNLHLHSVSKRIGIKREPLLIDFMDWLKDQPSETGLMDSEEVVSKYLEGN